MFGNTHGRNDMKIKTTLNREIRGKSTPPGKKQARRKPASNQKPRLSVRGRIKAVFLLIGRAFVPAVLTIFVIVAGIFTFSSDAFNLRNIRINGCQNQDTEALASIIWEEFPDNVLHIDLDRTKQRLEMETWVKRAEVHRMLPSSLVLRIEERKPTVLLELGGVQMIADNDGVLLGPYRREFGKIDSPVFRGLLGKDQKTYREHYMENAGRIRNGVAMLSEIALEMPQEVRNISEIDVAELNNLKIMMDNDPVEICLGSDNYLKRFSSFVGDPTKKYQELKNQGIQVAQVDLSNDGQIVYKSLEAVARERAIKLGKR